MTHKERPKTQVSVNLVLSSSGFTDVLLSKRFNTGFYDGYYGLPSGRLEYGETIINGLIRESKEEIGIVPIDFKLSHIMHRKEILEGGYENIGFFFSCHEYEGTIENLEPNKCKEIKWFSRYDLPDNIIPYIKTALLNIWNDINYSECGW